MAEVSSYEPGVPSWVDLATSDPEAARRFYSELFGWELEVGGPEFGHYATARVRGRRVAGLGGEPAPEGVPTAWTTYFAAADADAAVERVSANGGTVVVPPMDIATQGRMVVAVDPTGAMFGLWQAGEMIGAELVSEPGGVSWNELATRDLAAARRFYSAVFGYDWDDVDTGPGGPPYATFAVGGRLAGGAMQMTGDWPAQAPPRWTPYFAVEDPDAVVKRASELGGAVDLPPTDSPYGRFAALRDPQGAAFDVIRLPDDPPQA
jgi:predicted enzyme related to lactoylglutathione lyase